jgi:hypothetical protein
LTRPILPCIYFRDILFKKPHLNSASEMPALNIESSNQAERKKVAVCGGGLVI